MLSRRDDNLGGPHEWHVVVGFRYFVDADRTANASVPLSGSGTDPEEQALTYVWTQTSGTNAILNGASCAAPNSAATLVFSLAVGDGVK